MDPAAPDAAMLSEELLEGWRSEVFSVCLFCFESILFFFFFGESGRLQR